MLAEELKGAVLGKTGWAQGSPQILSETDWKAVCDVLPSRPLRDQIMIALLYENALRLSEARHLRVSDVIVHPQTPYLRVRAQKGILRSVPISQSLVALYNSYVSTMPANGTTTNWLFPSQRYPDRPLAAAMWARTIRQIGEQANVAKLSARAIRTMRIIELFMAGWSGAKIAAFAGLRYPYIEARLVHLHRLDGFQDVWNYEPLMGNQNDDDIEPAAREHDTRADEGIDSSTEKHADTLEPDANTSA